MNLQIKRMNAYKKGSELLLMAECPLSVCIEIESILKKDFANVFQRHSDGYEYFCGNPRKMASMIFQATDAAWTDGQQAFKRELLKNTLTISQDVPMPKRVKSCTASSKTTAEDKLHIECLVYLKTLFKDSKQRKAKMAVVPDAEDHTATPLPAIAKEEFTNKIEESSLSRWFSECAYLDATNVVKQGDWYTDYRGWANRNDIVPLVEKQAVAALKSLQPTVSVGQKTYGIKLRSSHAKIVVPALSEWLAATFVQAKVNVSKQSATRLLNMYKDWCNVNDLKLVAQRSNSTNFGKDIKTYGGVVQKKIQGIKGYHIDWQDLQAWLIEHHHMTSESNMNGS